MPRANASCWGAGTCEQLSHGFAMRVSFDESKRTPPPGKIEAHALPWAAYTPAVTHWCKDPRAQCDLIGASIPGAAFSQPPLAADPSRGWLITQASSDAATYFSADGGKSWRVLCASPPGGCEHTTTCGEGVGLFGDVLLVATNKEAKGCGYYCASSDFHRAVIDVQNTTVTCRWEKRQPVPVFHPRDKVGASAARRFVRAPDQTIYYGLQTMSSGAPETDRAYGFEGVYASTDLGKTFEARGRMPTATGT